MAKWSRREGGAKSKSKKRGWRKSKSMSKIRKQVMAKSSKNMKKKRTVRTYYNRKGQEVYEALSPSPKKKSRTETATSFNTAVIDLADDDE